MASLVNDPTLVAFERERLPGDIPFPQPKSEIAGALALLELIFVRGVIPIDDDETHPLLNPETCKYARAVLDNMLSVFRYAQKALLEFEGNNLDRANRERAKFCYSAADNKARKLPDSFNRLLDGAEAGGVDLEWILDLRSSIEDLRSAFTCDVKTAAGVVEIREKIESASHQLLKAFKRV